MKKVLLLVLALVMVLAVSTACAKPVSILGTWEEESGVGGAIEFKEEGECTLEVSGFTIGGTYEFDAQTLEGEATGSAMGQTMTIEFTYADGVITADGMTYNRAE